MKGNKKNMEGKKEERKEEGKEERILKFLLDSRKEVNKDRIEELYIKRGLSVRSGRFNKRVILRFVGRDYRYGEEEKKLKEEWLKNFCIMNKVDVEDVKREGERVLKIMNSRKVNMIGVNNI